MTKSTSLIIAFALIGFLVSCANEPVQSEPSDSIDSQMDDLTLVEIMEGLEADLADVSHGIWTQDPFIISQAATRIADHPQVPAEQLSVIKMELGSDLANFVRYDQMVHAGAVQLADSANALAAMDVLFSIYHTIEQGCFSCHASYQQRVSEALTK